MQPSSYGRADAYSPVLHMPARCCQGEVTVSSESSLEFDGRDACSKKISVEQGYRKLDSVMATPPTPHPPATDKDARPTNASHKSFPNRTTPGSEVITLEELAWYLRISKSTVYRCVRLGQLPAFRVGRQWRVSLRLVQDHLIESYEEKTGRKERPH
jgi:excisionase family DNA binding protein